MGWVSGYLVRGGWGRVVLTVREWSADAKRVTQTRGSQGRRSQKGGRPASRTMTGVMGDGLAFLH
jgi:hypothetical protein